MHFVKTDKPHITFRKGLWRVLLPNGSGTACNALIRAFEIARIDAEIMRQKRLSKPNERHDL